MFSRSNRIFVALILGGLLTLAAFIGTFFVAGVPDFGTVRLPEKTDTVRYRGPVELEYTTEREFGYLKNQLGFVGRGDTCRRRRRCERDAAPG